MPESPDKPSRIYWARSSYRPLESAPVPDDELAFFNQLYVHTMEAGKDPTMTWATEVDVTKLQAFLVDASQRWNVLLSPAHVLTKAVAHALAEHPHLNRRVVGRRVYAFRDVNVMMSFQNRRRGEADVLFLKSIDRLSLRDVAETIWAEINRARRGDWPLDGAKARLQRFGWRPLGMLARTMRWLGNRFNLPVGGSRLSRFAASPVLINCLNFPGAPPLRFYKATQIGCNSWTVHVALGPVENRPVAEADGVMVRPTMLLIVRIDHRLADAVELGRFTATIRDFFADPGRLEETGDRRRESAGEAGDAAPAGEGDGDGEGEGSRMREVDGISRAGGTRGGPLRAGDG